MKKIIVKSVDSYTSEIFTGKTLKEYIIYVALQDGTKISASTAIGEEHKKSVISDELLKYQFQGETLEIEEF